MGEDDTRALAVIYYDDAEDGSSDLLETYEARFYLVPEDNTWSEVTWENRSDIPGASQDPDQWYYELDDFEASQGLELIGTVDLKPALNARLDVNGLSSIDSANEGLRFFDTIGDDALQITANRPVDTYSLSANTDGDDLVSFLPTDYGRTVNGVPETFADESATGTESNEWLFATVNDVTNGTEDGGAGDDLLEVNDVHGADTQPLF